MRMRKSTKYAIKEFLTGALAVIIFAALFSAAIAFAYDTPDIVGYRPYVVSDGDTLWSIAKTSNGYNNVDIRKIVDDIETVSKCNSDIKEGDKLYIPIYEED